jgi:hypothetical protein
MFVDSNGTLTEIFGRPTVYLYTWVLNDIALSKKRPVDSPPHRAPHHCAEGMDTLAEKACIPECCIPGGTNTAARVKGEL